MPILEVKELRTEFRIEEGVVHAVDGVSFSVENGETLGIVGESGCGKSVTAMSIMRLIPDPPGHIASGQILWKGKDILSLPDEALPDFRGAEIAMIFQDPMTSLNPVFTIGAQIMEPLRKHMGLSKSAARDRARELLELVGISDAGRRLGDYPHQFSGGMRQRVMIAIALACDPKVLIADEPTTALDVTIQAQILELVRDLRQKLGMAIVWITHDLGVIAGIADRVIVMYGGQIVEQAAVKDLFARPRHPYTRALLKTVPSVRGTREAKLNVIEGQPPILLNAPAACSFADRCPHVFDRCRRENPLRRSVAPGHDVACFWSPEDGAAHA